MWMLTYKTTPDGLETHVANHDNPAVLLVSHLDELSNENPCEIIIRRLKPAEPRAASSDRTRRS